MYDLYNRDGSHQRTLRNPMNIRGNDGRIFADARAAQAADLAASGIYPVTDPGRPADEWSTVVNVTRSVVGGASLVAYETAPLSLGAAKELLRNKVKAARDARLTLIEWSDGESTHVVQIDQDSRGNLNGSYAMARDGLIGAEGTVWRMADNVTVSLTAEEVQALAVAVAAHVAEMFGIQAALEAAINDLPDLPACQAFDAEAGFPAIVTL